MNFIYLWEGPEPRSVEEARSLIAAAPGARVGQSLKFLELAARLMERFACDPYGAEADDVFIDGLVTGVTDARVFILGVSQSAQKVTDFIFETARSLGLHTYDNREQAGGDCVRLLEGGRQRLRFAINSRFDAWQFRMSFLIRYEAVQAILVPLVGKTDDPDAQLASHCRCRWKTSRMGASRPSKRPTKVDPSPGRRGGEGAGAAAARGGRAFP